MEINKECADQNYASKMCSVVLMHRFYVILQDESMYLTLSCDRHKNAEKTSVSLVLISERS